MIGNEVKKKTICFLFNNEQQNYLRRKKKLYLQYSDLYPKKKIYLINPTSLPFSKKIDPNGFIA